MSGFAPKTTVERVLTSAGSPNLISAHDLSTGSATLDVFVGNRYAKALVFVDFTFADSSTITSVDATFLGSPEGKATADFFSRQSLDISSGVATSDDFSFTKAVTASGRWYWEADVRGLDYFRMVFSDGGTAVEGDDITVQVKLLTGE